MNAFHDNIEATSIETGLYGFDRLIRMRPGNVVVIAGHSSVGKTALACRMLEHVLLRQQKPAGVFTFEMSARDFIGRMASSISGVPFVDFDSPGPAQKAAIVSALGQIKRAPLRVCDAGGLTFEQIAGLARRWKVRFGIELLIVDYLGMIRPEGRNCISIPKRLKSLARQLGIVTVVVSHLNQPEGDEELPRIRGFESNEDDADVVLTLHTKEIVGPNRRVLALLEKNRSGPLGEVELDFTGPTMRFESVSPISEEDMP